MKKSQLVIVYFIIFFVTAYSDTIIIKRGPALYEGGPFLSVVEIFPAKSRLQNDRPRAFYYKIIATDTSYNYESRMDYKLMWEGELVDKYGPEEAIISHDGHLVTISNTDSHSVVIYNPQGKLLADLSYQSIISAEDINANFYSEGWRNKAQFIFGNPNNTFDIEYLYIILRTRSVIAIHLETGNHEYGELKKFPYVELWLNHEGYSDYAPIMKTWLDYSSITELVMCKDSK